MDSVSQIVLGAAVGEAVCGRRAGNKALLWGAVAGTIPDLDILASPFLDTVQELYFHRSLTHSVFFALVTAPLLGLLFQRLYKKDETSFRDWTLLFFFGFTTHALLDCFTTWGTKIFYPVSDLAVSFHSIFVIDPLYTVPFIICLIPVFFYNKKDKRRRIWTWTGIGISTFYLMLSLYNKLQVNEVFEQSLKEQNISYSRYSTKPTPFNIILWSATAETENGYYIGYYSFFDENKKIDFKYFPKQHALLKPWMNNPKLQRLIDITEGYYIVEKEKNTFLIKDLRFGQLDGWGEGKEGFTFVYKMQVENGQLSIERNENDLKKARELLADLWERIFGKEKVS